MKIKWDFWNDRPFQKRRDVKCLWCYTEFRVYGNKDAGNRGEPGSQYDEQRNAWCPTCKIFSQCKDVVKRT